MDAVLSSIKSVWDSSIILTGDTNIDIYKQVLDTYQLSCHVTKPTRKSKKLIDHIWSNSNIIKNKILHSDILPHPTKNNHDASCLVINLETNKFKICSKFSRNLKLFDSETYYRYKALPLHLLFIDLMKLKIN